MKIIWATDIHLDHVSIEKKNDFYNNVNNSGADILLISGDITTSDELDSILSELDKLDVEVYFVLGNHDFYGSSIFNVRKIASNHKTYLTQSGIISLSNSTGLIGHDGWYDMRNGVTGKVIMNDFNYINDFDQGSIYIDSSLRDSLVSQKAKELSQEAADHFKKYLKKGFRTHDHMIIVTHVSPFEEAVYYRGRKSDKYFLPFYSSRIEGDTILDEMKNISSNKQLTILCGHTHGESEYKPQDNITVRVGAAEYQNPSIQQFQMEI